MNTNLIHNILNVVILVSGSVAGFDFASLAAFGITAAMAAKITAIAAGIKLVMNSIRDGLGGMIKEQPPVV